MMIKSEFLPQHNTRLNYSNMSKQHILNSGMAHTTAAQITLQKNTSALL